MDARGRTRAAGAEGRRNLDELWTSTKQENVHGGVEREEEALEVDVRAEARGGAERRRERQFRARPLRAGGQGEEIRGGNEQL